MTATHEAEVARTNRRAAELVAAADPAVNYVRLIAGLLELAGTLAHQFTADHGPACDCDGCDPPMRAGVELGMTQEELERYRRPVQQRKHRLAGLIQAAAFGCEFTASAMAGVIAPAGDAGRPELGFQPAAAGGARRLGGRAGGGGRRADPDRRWLTFPCPAGDGHLPLTGLPHTTAQRDRIPHLPAVRRSKCVVPQTPGKR